MDAKTALARVLRSAFRSLAKRAALPALVTAVCLAAAVHGFAAQMTPSTDRGRLLYENHCRVCHTEKVHHRTPRLPISIDDLRDIVAMWAREEKLHWSDEDINDVVQYLNMSVYHF